MKEWQHRDWAWQRLRLIRSAPPGLAADSAIRARTMSAGLEQAEQLSRGAESMAPASKPLLLFYALSQAGRAIAAVHLKEHWQPNSHGLTWLGPSHKQDLMERVVQPQPSLNSSFDCLARAIGSGSLSKAVELGAVWTALPELAMPPLPSSKDEWRAPLYAFAPPDEGLPHVSRHGLALVVAGLRDITTRQAITDELEHYPSARGGLAHAIPADARETVMTEPVPSGGNGPRLVWSTADPTSAARFNKLNEIAPPYQGSNFRPIIPELPTRDFLHPLMLWWLVLFALSNLARYEPDTWTRCLDVRSSRLAVPLESAMEEALASVPHFILEAVLGHHVEPHTYASPHE